MAELTQVTLTAGVPGGTGEVPTLAPIRDAIIATNTALATIDSRVDGLETLVGATNTAIAATNTAIGTTNTTLTTIDGRVDGLETLITSTNTKLDTAITALQIIDNMVLAAGTANIGDVDVLTLGGQTPAFGSGSSGATVLRTVISSDQLASALTAATAMSSAFQLVDVPTDGTGAQREVAVAHGANPTAVAAAVKVVPKANRAGIPFVIGGHPNVITRSATIDDADGAQTNASLLTVSAGSVIVITALSAIFFSTTASQACAVRIGFGTATLAAASEAGAAGILLEGKYLSGGGNQKGNGAGILGVGADNEDLRITCDDPVGGSLFVTFSYYTVES